MSIRVDCKNCGKTSSFRDEYAGQFVTCKACGVDVQVPGERVDSSRRKKKKSGMNPIVLGAIGVALLFGVVLVFSANKGGGANNAVAPGPDGNGANAAAPPTAPDMGNGGDSRFNAPAVQNLGSGASGTGGNAAPQVGGGSGNPMAGVGLGSQVAVVTRLRTASKKESEYEEMKEPPDIEPPLDWNVTVDAPKEVIDFSPSKKLVRVPIPNPKSSRLARGGEEDVVFPVVPSPFVAVGQNAAKKDVREIWDLSKPKKVGTITDLGVETTRNALSPDGKFFAGITEGRETVIGVWDVDEKKVLIDIPIERTSSFWVPLLALPSSNRLIYFETFGDNTAQIFDLPSGELVKTVSFGWADSKAVPVFSPNGKYFAWPSREGFWQQQIAFYEMETGEIAGKLELPIYGSGVHMSVEGLAFSPDGEELAAVIDGWTCTKIIIWKLSDGSVVDHMTFKSNLRKGVLGDQESPFRTVNPLVFFPGGDRLLAYEHGIIDRKTGLVVWQIPRSNIVYGRKRWPLDRSYVTVMSLDGQVGSVVVYKLPEDKISDATAKAAAKFGVKSETPYTWIELGPEGAANLEGLQIVSQKTDVPWAVAPDPAADSTDSAPPRSFAPGKLPGTIQQVALTGGTAPRVLVARSSASLWYPRLPKDNAPVSATKSNRFHDRAAGDDEAFGAIGRAKRPRLWIDLYDPKTGKRTHEFRMKYDGDLASVSPDGTKLAVLKGQGSSRIDVYRTENGEHVAGWSPSGGGDADGAAVMSAMFAGNDHIVSLSGSGRLTAYHLPDIKAVWAANGASLPVASAGGQYVAYSNGKSLCVVETSTGALKGVVADTGAVHAAAFRPDGKSIAVLSEYKNGYYLFTIDQTTGKASDPFPVPVLSPHLRWVGDKHVLLDHRKLVDVERKVVAWSYDGPKEGEMIPSFADGAAWFIADVNGKMLIGGVPVPGADAKSELAGANLTPEFVLQPGGACTIDLSALSHSAVDSSFKTELAEALTKTLAANNIQTGSGQAVTLVATVIETNQGTRTARYGPRHFMRDNEAGVVDVNYTMKSAQCRLAFMVNGAVAWEDSLSVAIHHPWDTSRKTGAEIASDMQKEYDAGVRNQLKAIRLPPFVFTPRSANGIGRTVLTNAR